MNWYFAVLQKYADFSGRARRKEYWMFMLFNYTAYLLLIILDFYSKTDFDHIGGIFYYIYAVAVLLPTLAVKVRRLHDIDKSGWWIFIQAVPLIGGIWFLILMCTEGSAGYNYYGNDPKEKKVSM